MVGYNNPSKISVLANEHAIVMHGIAQLAFFGNDSTLRRRFGYAGGYFVLVSVNGPLPCCKTKQQNPGANDMAFISVQFKIPYGSFHAKLIKSADKASPFSNNIVVKNVSAIL